MKRLLVSTFVLAFAALAAPVRAQPGGPCREESLKLCPKVAGGHRLHCLEEHRQELSPVCQESLARMRAAGEEFKRDCREDSGKLCPGQEGRKLVACLETALSRLSPACAERVHKIQSERKVRKERIPAACREDSEKLCAQADASGEDILVCLKNVSAKLGDGCRQALAHPAPEPAPAAPGSGK